MRKKLHFHHSEGYIYAVVERMYPILMIILIVLVAIHGIRVKTTEEPWPEIPSIILTAHVSSVYSLIFLKSLESLWSRWDEDYPRDFVYIHQTYVSHSDWAIDDDASQKDTQAIKAASSPTVIEVLLYNQRL